MHILLEVLPSLPGATIRSEDPFEHRDTAFDSSPKAPQLLVNPAGAHHIGDLQPCLFGKGHILDSLLLGPPQIVLSGESPVEAGLARIAPVDLMLTLQHRLHLRLVSGIALRDQTIDDQ